MKKPARRTRRTGFLYGCTKKRSYELFSVLGSIAIVTAALVGALADAGVTELAGHAEFLLSLLLLGLVGLTIVRAGRLNALAHARIAQTAGHAQATGARGRRSGSGGFYNRCLNFRLLFLLRVAGQNRKRRLNGLHLRLAVVVPGLGMTVAGLTGLDLRLAMVVAGLGMAVAGLGGLNLRLAMVVAGLGMAVAGLGGMSLGLAMVVTRLTRLSMVMPRSLGLTMMMTMMVRSLSKCKRCRSQDGECCQYVFHCCFIGVNGYLQRGYHLTFCSFFLLVTPYKFCT